MKTALVLYVPVLHEGYIKFFEKHRGDADALYLLGGDITAEFFSLGREIRALDPEAAQRIIAAMNIFPKVLVLQKEDVKDLNGVAIVTADDELCRKVARSYFSENSVTYEPVFLRWDEKNVKSSSEVKYDRVSEDPFDRKMCAAASNEAEKSSDWWRHVGAVVTKGNKIIFSAHNHHVPSEYTPYAQGDPRDVVAAGTLNLVYTSLHAEQTIVAEAARKGAPLEGTNMYMNIFPCPLCAKLIAYAGIKKCFFRTGSAWLDAESVLRANGVEIVLVK